MKGHALATVEPESLELILAQAREGSREAFDALIRRFEKNVMKTALFLTRNIDDAQDVAQEVYLKIYRFLDTYEETARIESWVYRITVNAARDLQRRKRFWVPLESIFPAGRPPDPVGQSEVRSRLIESLKKLTLNERAAFIFKELQDMDTEQIAEILGCSPVTVRGYLHTGKKKLQKFLRDYREIT